jgi:hypothetical protein
MVSEFEFCNFPEVLPGESQENPNILLGSLYHGFPDVSGKTKANNFANLLTTGFREQFAEGMKGTSTSPLKIPNTTNEFLTKKSSSFLVLYHSIRI